MLTLGLSGMFSTEGEELAMHRGDGFFHDAAACLVRDGELLAAVEEERLNRIKHTAKFPTNAIRACLSIVGVAPAQVDAVGYYFTENVANYALNLICLEDPTMPARNSRELITERLNGDLGFSLPDERIRYAKHHVAHALSSFIRSGMDEALVVVMDGQGDRHSTTIYRGLNGELESLAAYDVGKSFGKFYRDGTKQLGYGLGDEYKVMGLAPYGNPETYSKLFDAMSQWKGNGEFDLCWRNDIIAALDIRPRRKGDGFSQKHMDLAAGLQRTLERIAVQLLEHWADQTGLANLCFVGGVAHNSTLNGLILRSGKFREVFIHPASHDAGAAEGAALSVSGELGAKPSRQPRMRSASLGPDLGTAVEIEKELAAWSGLIHYEQPADIIGVTARLLAEGAVLGWAQGASEFGPRALGNRSILADARPAENKQRINSMVKKREGYRPFAPVVLAEAAETYFDIPKTQANYDFMSFVVDVREEWRSTLGAVTHVDGSARVQVIDPESNARFHQLVQRFGELTGTPVVLNTSFNNNAEPIVQSVPDAVTCFLTTELDYLVVEDFLVSRRPGQDLALGSLIPRFRPVTRLAKQIKVTAAGDRAVSREIYLEYPNGPRAEVSPAVYTILETADGVASLETLAAPAGGLNDTMVRELYDLWQRRLLVLQPAVAD